MRNRVFLNNGTGQNMSIDLAPAQSVSLAQVVEAGITGGSVAGCVNIRSGRLPGEIPLLGQVIPGATRHSTPEEDAQTIRLAKDLQARFASGELAFNPFGFSTDGSATNCIGFAATLQNQ